MPPPKRLTRNSDGRLIVSTFEGIRKRAYGEVDIACLTTMDSVTKNQICRTDTDAITIGCEAGFKMFTLAEPVDCFILNCSITNLNSGKCGLVARLDPDSRDGYYFSLDLNKGVTSCRSWATGEEKSGDEMMQFNELQPGYWVADRDKPVELKLISFGSYHELSIDGEIVLSLVDSTFSSGLVGFYVETATLSIRDLKIEKIESPSQSDDHLTHGPHS